MSRFRKLVLASLVGTLALVIMGVVVRATDSGLGCPDWPLCHGQLVPALGDFKAWAEWIHRFIAAIIGVLVLAMAVLAVIDHRDRPSIMWPSVGAVALVGFQAWLGEETVRLGNSGPSVTAHLATAMAVAGLLTFIFVRSGYPARMPGRGSSQRLTLLVVLAAASTYLLLLFGSNVTGLDQAPPYAATVFGDWPLMGGAVIPPFGQMSPAVRDLALTQALHRYVGVLVGLILIATWIGAYRSRQANRTLFRLVTVAAVLFPVQALIGAFQIWTQLAPWSQTLHVVVAALIWTATIAAVFVAYYGARVTVPAGAGAGSDPSGVGGGGGPAASAPAPKRSAGDTIRAYVALTKPRIIELLLITTVPAMVLATRNLPTVHWDSWGALVFWTLLGGTLAAGSANAINQYLDRDIDLLMTRTRRRPLPANSVQPEQALVFGIVLGLIAIALLAWTVNLVAALLTLLAIAFYVVVYTMLLKRTTTMNIVIGGAAGALPPVIGWAAVTGRVDLPALMLFAIVFYWTPPHFWALALRITKDYAAAGVPMLPVVRGAAETTRQIFRYTIQLVALTLIFFVVAGMGLVYLAAAIVLGAMFLWQAARLSRTVTVEGTTAGAIRLYRFSISYLTLLFVAVAVDALVVVRPL